MCNVVSLGNSARGLFLRQLSLCGKKGTPPCDLRRKIWRRRRHKILEVYRSFAEDWMRDAGLDGAESDGQKFPGAVYTLCIEAMMQDKKALQAGTSHFLGQNFAKAFDVKFQSQAGQLEYAWATSWGVSTRLVGGLIMTQFGRRRPGVAAAPGADPCRHCAVSANRMTRGQVR